MKIFTGRFGSVGKETRLGFWNLLDSITIKHRVILFALSLSLVAGSSFGQAPTTQASGIVPAPDPTSTSLRIDWTNGNGANRIVVVSTTNGVYTPTNSIAAPGSNPSFTGGSDLDAGAGNVRCVFNSATDGGGTFTVVSNLTVNTPYLVRIYEYNGSAGTTAYNLTANSTNPTFVQNITTAGANTFNVLSNVSTVAVRAWGGGGGGGGANGSSGNERRGGGGGGGAYQFNSSVGVTAGGSVSVTVGGGGTAGNGGADTDGGPGTDSSFPGSVTVTANHGLGGGAGVSGGGDSFGAGGAAGTGTHDGGAGMIGTSGAGGGVGGGAGGTNNPGTAGSSGGAGGTEGGGAGGAAATSNQPGNAGTVPGGGGSGGWEANADKNGGVGARGQVIVSWTNPIPMVSILGSSTTIGNPVFQVVFSKPVNAGTFVGTDVTLAGTATGTLSANVVEIAPNDGTTFSVTVSGMTGSGTVIASMAAGGVTDPSGNTSLASNTGTTINYTHIISSVTVNPNAGNVVIGQTVTVAITAAGSATGLLAGAGSTINGVSVVGNFFEVGGGVYTYTYTPSNNDPTWALNSLPISVRLSDGTNTSPATVSFTGGSASATDLTRPVVNSNTVGTITPTGFTFTINLSEGSSTTYWEVTTSASTPTAAQIKAGTGTGHVSNGNFAVASAATPVNQGISGLTAATSYFIYSVSEDAVTNQSTPVTTNSVTTVCAPPTAQPTAAGSPFTSILANSMTFNWVRGDGTGGVIVVARQTSAVSFAPTSGQTYSGQINANFGLATDQGSGNKIVYRGSGTSVNITGLSPSTTYQFAVYEWNTANDCYLTTSPYTNSQATIAVANEATLANAAGNATLTSLAINTGTSVAAFSFDVTDAGADGSETRITQFVLKPGGGNDFPDFTQLIAPTGVELYDNAANGPAGTITVAAGTITIAGIPAGTGQLGNVPNGTTKRYTVRVFFNNPLNSAIRSTADGGNLVLSLLSTDVTTTAGFSGMSASNVNSGATNGVIDVVATRLAFVTGATNTLLLVPMATVTVEAVDGPGNRDIDFVSIVGITSTGSLQTPPVNATFAAGLGTWNNNLIHTATATARTLTTNSVLTNPVSANFDITASNLSDIIVDPAYVYPTNISYETYQEPTNITVSGTSLEVGRFIIRDGGAAMSDGDLAPTIVSQLTLDFGPNFGLIRRVELYDGTGVTPIPGTDVSVTTQTVTFGALSLNASDNGSVAFNVRVSFRNLVTDNAQFSIAIANPTSTQANVSSTIPTPAGAVTSTSGNNNRIEVVAAQYRFVQQPTSSDVNATMVPSPTVEAVDGFLNRDLDYVASVDLFSTGSMTPSPQTTAFVSGLGTYNSIVHNVSGSGLQLFTSGPLLNVASSVFQIVAQSSNITENTFFIYPSNIAYNNFQEAVNITSLGTSLVVAAFNINDGGVAFPDGDLAPTVLTNLQLDLGPNYTFIRRIALYDASGTIEVPGSEQVVGSQIVNFGGLTLSAPDDGTLTFTVRVSFNAPVVDRQQISFTVSAASSQPGNSRFATANAGGATTSLLLDNNRIQATANRMIFIQQPTNTLNGLTMAPPVTVGAVDPLGTIDIDFVSSVGVTSNGTMSVSPQFATFVNGVGTYPSIVHVANGNPLVLTTNSILANVASNPFQITSSSASDIIANGAFVYPTNVGYQNFQESVNILNSPTSLNVARFDVRDGGGVADADGAPTYLNSLTLDLGPNFSFIRRIALYDAAGTAEIGGTEQAVVGQFVNFSGILITAPDNGSISFTVRVSFNSVVTDNQQFSFTVNAATTFPNFSSTFTAPNAGGAVSSTAGDNNRIEVTATQIAFSTNLTSPLLAGVNISTQQATPVVRTVDIFGNIDRDYGTTLNIGCAIPTSVSTLNVDAAPPNGGVYTFPGTFQWTPQTGNGTLTISVGGLTSAISNGVTVIAGAATQVVAGTASPATISSLTTSSPGVVVFNFDIIDDRPPVASTNNDGLPTMFNQLIITANAGFNTITDWTQAIAGARLSDGTNFIDVTAAAVSNAPNSITFSGIPTGVGQLGRIADDATKSYSLSIYLLTSLGGTLPSTIDGLQFQFESFSSNINTIAHSTTFGPVSTNTNSGNANVVSVIADRLRFISPTFPTTSSLNTPLPGLIVEATDQYNNRDRGFTGANSTVREVSNATSAGMLNQPVVGTTQFGTGANLGLLVFSNSFQYTSGSNGDDVTLTVKAGPGPGTTCGVNGIICTTPTPNEIKLQASFESSIVGDPTFTQPSTLDYAYRQENSNITVSSTSLSIARMLLVDGSRVGPPFTTGTDIDGIPNNDLDGAATNLSSLTLRITNPANLRRIALYSGGSEISGTEINVVGIPAITPGTPFYDFVFAGSPLVSAADGTQVDITVRASFRNTAGYVTDRDPINVSVVAASTSTGSSFFTGWPTPIAGVDNGYQTPTGFNIVDVVATKFDFVSQPSPFAGIAPQPVVAGTVEAHDQWGLLDTDYNVGATATAPVPVSFSGSFVNGVLSLGSMLYGSPGNGTVTVIENIPIPIIRSDMNNSVGGLSNVSVQCNHVDVVHVTTQEATGGVVSSTNLIGGTFNHIIFGVTFQSAYGVTTPSVAPILQSFVIDFSNPITGIIANTGADFPKVYESPTPTYNAGTATDITSQGGNLVVGTQAIVVNLGAGAYDLSTPGSSITYFLEVDIDATASGSSPSLQPSVVDAGFGPTDTNITTNLGSAVSNVSGKTYSFAAIFPPVLTSSYPSTGQLNVDPNQPTISLTFGVPVWTLDEQILLYDQTAGTPPVVCTPSGVSGSNGEYNNRTGLAVNTLLFDIPTTLIPNHVYFVTIAAGNLTNLTGIMDEANNTYPGFNYPGTLYFKAASPTPPILLTTPTAPLAPYISNVTLNGATINATYDQQGTTYYLVLKAGAPSGPPTNSQIRTPGTYGSPTYIAGSGSFQMVQTNPISQYGLIQPQATGLPGPIPPANQFLPNQQYEVWMYAENNALPTPFATAAPYGGLASGFVVGGAGPTLIFTTPPSNPASIVSAPVVRVCSNSYQYINQPIVISEPLTGQFNTGGTAVSLNIGLPAGFQFDVSRTGGVPTYGTLTLVGSDFIPGSGAIDFLGNSIVRIRYANLGSASLDKIIISNLRVLATSTTTGNMFRIGGTALTGPIPDLFTMGTLTSFAAPLISFTNSYSEVALGNPTPVVTSIPNNGDDLDPTTDLGTISLKPVNPNPNDFGPNIFSGLGVNINVLSLSAVTVDVPFNITITHTDNNGCISDNAVQYTVYDHTTAVKFSTTTPNAPPNGAAPVAFVQSPFCAINTNFVNTLNAVNPYIAPALGVDLRYMAWNNLAGFYLRNTGPGTTGDAITAKIPANAPPQIMSGPEWASVIASLPIATGPATNIPGGNPPTTQSYYFDLAHILNAPTLFPGVIDDPYNNFKSALTAQGNYFYNGGSLGLIEFTGIFQSTTNATVIVPRTQVVEIFVPAVPLVETSLANRTYLDTNDPDNMPGAGGINGPTNRGTNVYCQSGGVIEISGFPQADPGNSAGRFTLLDHFSGATIYDESLSITPLGFVDNGNGTAVLNPNIPVGGPGSDPLGKIRNGYKDIRVVYTFRDLAAPTLCEQSAYQVIRITPNPVAGFTFSTPVTAATTPFVENSSASCVGQPIQFVSTASINPADITAKIIDYSWDFGDVSSSTNRIEFNPSTYPAIPPSAQPTPLHTYDAPSGSGSPYTVTFNAISNYGCKSGPPVAAPGVPGVDNYTGDIDVGAIPAVKFRMEGVSTADVFKFNSNNEPDVSFPATGAFSSVNSAFSTTVSANDTISYYNWNFGDGSPIVTRSRPTDLATNVEFNKDVVTHNYASPGKYQIDLTVTTSLGCRNSLQTQQTYRNLVVLRREVLAVGSAYVQDFETGDGQWQFWGTGETAALISQGANSASWEYGTPSGTEAIPDEPLISKTKIWKTNILTGAETTDYYNPGEKSALYSPSFDLTNLARPMISFNAVVQMENSDGVVLEYSLDNLNIADPNKKWYALGVIGDGEDWFTDQGIAGRPGTQAANDFGWSKPDNHAWQAPKHVLDTMFNYATPPNKAVFRWALGSAAPSVDLQGFTLDNVRIGDRTRTILLESFANTSNTNPSELSENTFVAGFIGGIGTEVVKLNYHLNFPGNDPFNQDNPGAPSSRALFYDITSTPKSVLDGEKDAQDRQISVWGLPLYNLRTLQLAQADIKIIPVTNADGSIDITTKITSRVLTGLQPNTVVHVVVMERNIPLSGLPAAKQSLVKSGETNFEYVVKAMLPSAAGTPLGAVLPDTVSRFFGPFKWWPEPSKLYPDPDDLIIAVFVQESTPPFEVYQVELYDTPPIADPTVVTGLEPIPAEQILVYPNPANNEMTVQLPGLLAKPAAVNLIDQTGRTSLQSAIPEGSDRKTLNVSELSSGVYIMTIDLGQGVLTRKKVVVVH